jgi:hypothetical protein
MARLLEVKELEARKRALVAEGDVYRQILRLEIQNARLYGIGMRRRCSSFGTGNPLLLFGIPLLNQFLKRRITRRLGFFGKVLSSWQMISRGLGIASAFLASRRVFLSRPPGATKF